LAFCNSCCAASPKPGKAIWQLYRDRSGNIMLEFFEAIV
jgi:hypothetical protein